MSSESELGTLREPSAFLYLYLFSVSFMLLVNQHVAVTPPQCMWHC